MRSVFDVGESWVVLRRVWLGGRVAALCALWSCAAAAPTESGSHSASAAGSTAVEEKVSDGKSTVTVLSRPGDERRKPKPAVSATPPLTDEACQQRPACAERGLCTASGQDCVARSYADCERMTACASGKCAFTAGQCQPVPDCKNAHECGVRGRCQNDGAGCVAGAVEDCRGATLCPSDGLCSLADGVCVAQSPGDCRRAAACLKQGRCTPRSGACVALRDNECRRSEGCRRDGRCSARGGTCVKSCRESEACANGGRCGEPPAARAGEASCIVVSDQDCQKATICAELGHCSMGLARRCEAGDDVECRRSRLCREQGRCTATRGRCWPGSKAECEQATVACKREGRCNHDAGRCVR